MSKCFYKEERIMILPNGELEKCYFQFINACSECSSCIKSNDLIISIILSPNCNLDCTYCADKNETVRAKFLPLDTEMVIKKLMELIELNKEKNISILFPLFEPLLKVDSICKILKLIEQTDVKIMIPTNGTIYSEKLINALSVFDSIIFINLNGHKEFHNKFKPNSYDLIVENLEKFYNNKSSRTTIQLEAIIFNESVEQMDDILYDININSKFCDNLVFIPENLSMTIESFLLSKAMMMGYNDMSGMLLKAYMDYNLKVPKFFTDEEKRSILYKIKEGGSI